MLDEIAFDRVAGLHYASNISMATNESDFNTPSGVHASHYWFKDVGNLETVLREARARGLLLEEDGRRRGGN